jgi:hypothetical protein
MPIKKENKIKRKDFFSKSFIGFIGLTFITSPLFNLFKKENKKVVIKINPNAVSRKNR